MIRLPQEIIHHILEFAGKVKYRHGKYMYQISNDDERYTMLLHLCRFKSPPPGGDSSGKVTLPCALKMRKGVKMPKIMPNVIQGWSIAITPIQSS